MLQRRNMLRARCAQRYHRKRVVRVVRDSHEAGKQRRGRPRRCVVVTAR